MDRIKTRRKTRPLFLGGVQIGGDAPIVVQSMTCTDTRDTQATVRQIRALADEGCEVVRVAVPDMHAAAVLSDIKKRISLPLVADIHFDHRIALEALRQGVDGIRINPGNMRPERMKDIVSTASDLGSVIRIGVNAGSLQPDILKRHGGPTAQALAESALRSLALLEDMNFTNMKVSLKSSDVLTTIEAYREVAQKCDYPLHVGVTEAGTMINASIKSSLGIGILIYEGIGDTIRVSVTGDPLGEMKIAYGILRALGVRKFGPDIISCPSCGRCEIDVLRLAEEVERKLSGMKQYLKIALMGCVVNGPGEAQEADIGIAGGRGFGYLFKKGKKIRKIREEEFLDVLLQEIAELTGKASEGA